MCGPNRVQGFLVRFGIHDPNQFAARQPTRLKNMTVRRLEHSVGALGGSVT